MANQSYTIFTCDRFGADIHHDIHRASLYVERASSLGLECSPKSGSTISRMSCKAKRQLFACEIGLLAAVAATFITDFAVSVVALAGISVGLCLGIEGARCGWWKGCGPTERKS